MIDATFVLSLCVAATSVYGQIAIGRVLRDLEKPEVQARFTRGGLFGAKLYYWTAMAGALLTFVVCTYDVVARLLRIVGYSIPIFLTY